LGLFPGRQNVLSCRMRHLSVLLVLMLAGCGPSDDTATRSARKGILVINNSAEPAGLDPQIVTGVIESRIVNSLFEGLVEPNPRNLEPEPATAERWTLSPEGRTWTFYLRPSARWSNGDPVTASDFVFSYRRILSPGLSSEYAWMLFAVKGARDFNSGKVTDFSTVGFRAVDERTLEIQLEHPTPYFLQLLCHHSWLPVHPPTILSQGPIDAKHGRWTQPGVLVGNGAFILQSWEVARRITVRKNPSYWDASSVALEGVEFRAISDLYTEERAFRGGELHITGSVPPYKVHRLIAAKDPSLRVDPYLSVSYIRVNTQVTGAPAVAKALSDVRVRQALGMVLDRRLMAEKVLRAGESPALGMTPPGTAGYVSRHAWSEDRDAARRLLAEAGYPGGKGFPVVEYLYNTSEGSMLAAQAYQEMWRRELGIEVVLRNQEWKVYLQSLQKGDYQLARSAWTGDYNDPNTFLEMFTTGNEMNQTGWSDAEYDRRVALAAAEPDRERRYEHFQAAEARLVAGAPVLPVVFNRSKFLIRPEVEGWYPTLLDVHPLKHVRLKRVPDETR
jgi:oligopeptide transport system substrate-binding protein